MTRHLHSTETLLQVGAAQLFAEVLAGKVTRGEVIWNPETDEFIDLTAHADSDSVLEAQAAIRRLLVAEINRRTDADIAELLS